MQHNPTPSDTLEVSVRQVITWPQDPQGAWGWGEHRSTQGDIKPPSLLKKVLHNIALETKRCLQMKEKLIVKSQSSYFVRSNIFFLLYHLCYNLIVKILCKVWSFIQLP